MSSSSGFLGSSPGRAAKRCRVANFEERESSNSDHKETDHAGTSFEEIEPSNPRADHVPDIFLSHSGKQKYLVECLYIALQRTNHTIFFNQETLPTGRYFPSYIKDAAKGCKIGVIVLSEDFLTSKWPMIELEILVSERGPDPCVLPLFYELSPADLKSPEKLLKWRQVWQDLGGENSAKKWEQALKNLRGINGKVYIQGSSIGAYVNVVVQCICDLLPCHVPYDCSFVQGQPRLIQEIAAKFKHSNASQACMVGLHGVGGSGKTTLCKVMVNYYCSHYGGKSFYIEFPSPGGGDVSTIVSELCKKALKKLTDASYEHLLNNADDFDQVVRLMRDRLGLHDIFLAIDNVWESSLEVAKRVLWAGFSANSKILVTSRSKEVLKDLLMVEGHVDNASVASLPAPEREEAFQIFQECFKPYDLSALVDRNQVDKILERCRFNGRYHALALKALAKYVKTVCKAVDLEGIKQRLSWVLKEISRKNLSDLEKVIRLSYDILDKPKKDFFLDIVVLLMEGEKKMWKYRERVWDCISFIHWELPKIEIARLINELSLDGLIQTVEDGFRTSIQVHDLYRELALREFASSPRFLMVGEGYELSTQCRIGGITKSLKKIEWEKLESVIFRNRGSSACLFEELQQRKCLELKLLVARNIKIKSRIRLDSMPTLRFLELDGIGLLESDSEKEDVVQSHLLQPLEQVPRILLGNIKNERTGFVWFEGLVDTSRILCLNGLDELRVLNVFDCGFVQEIVGLRTLGNLQRLTVGNCDGLDSVDGLCSLTCLERLELYWNGGMKEIGGLSCTLKDVEVVSCGSLKRMPDMSSLTCLERLRLSCNGGMEEIGGLSCTLKDVEVDSCGSLKRMPDMSSLTCLERLSLSENEGMEEIGGLSCTLKDVEVQSCWSLKRMPDMSSLTCLERLELISNREMEEVGGEYLSSTLKHLGISTGWRRSLRSFPRLDRCMHLETWETDYPQHVSSIQTFTNLHMCLQHLTIRDESSIRKIDVECFINLKKLRVMNCGVLEEMGDLSALHHLERLDIEGCSRLKMLNVECPRLETLKVVYCKELEEIKGDNLKALRSLSIRACDSLKRFGGMDCSIPEYFEGSYSDLLALYRT